jgi:hypothetical protein
MPCQPGGNVRASRDNRQPFVVGPIDRRSYQSPGESPTAKGLGDFGVDERDAITADLVNELRQAQGPVEHETMARPVIDHLVGWEPLARAHVWVAS